MKNKLIAFGFCLFGFAGYAQIEPSVDLVTGTADFTIPLYTINEGDLQDKGLNYTFNENTIK